MKSLDLLPIDIKALKACEKSFELNDINQALCDVLDYLHQNSYLSPLDVTDSLTRIIYFLDDESGSLASNLDDTIFIWFNKTFGYLANHYFYVRIYKTSANFANNKLKTCWIHINNDNCESVSLPEVITAPLYMEDIVNSRELELVELPKLKNATSNFRVYSKRSDHHQHVSIYVSLDCAEDIGRTLHEDDANATVYAQ